MNIFIDTNIFHDFYRMASEDIEELKKLVNEVASDNIILWLPEQVKYEFYTNRESVLKNDVNKTLKALQGYTPQYPNILKHAAQFNEIQDKFKDYKTELKTLIDDLDEKMVKRELAADLLIKDLFEIATPIEITTEIHDEAKRRIELGRPPIKSSTNIRDGVNWESLKASEIDGPLFMITGDTDYYCPLNKKEGHNVLIREWSESKLNKLVFYQSLTEFFKEHLSNINLREEDAKAKSVEFFVKSASFQQTHFAVDQLGEFSSLDAMQTTAVLSAALENSQIRSILLDDDVFMFYESILGRMPIPNVDVVLAAKVSQLIESKKQAEADWYAEISS
jgi:predicted nucleic acid-binding protein